MVKIKRGAYLTQIASLFRKHSIVALLGARQCGKTTLSLDYARDLDVEVHRFDLKDPKDQNLLTDPLLALKTLKGLIVIDEIQRFPELFRILQTLQEQRDSQKEFLVLGSVSPTYLRQTTESLEGQVGYLELSPFSCFEIQDQAGIWLKGGYPHSYLADNNESSFNWRKNLVLNLIERDLRVMGMNLQSDQLNRLLTMVSHLHGNILNHSDLSRSLGVTPPTIRRYIDLLEATCLVRRLPAWYENTTKRHVRAPKIFFRDSGLLHYFLHLADEVALKNQPRLGASWEAYALEQTIQAFGFVQEECYFWKLHTGAKLDLLVVRGKERRGFEFKYSTEPKVTQSMYSSLDYLNLDNLTVVHTGDSDYALTSQIHAVSLSQLIRESKKDRLIRRVAG